MTCNACRGLGVNVDALPDEVYPKLSLRDAVGLYGECPMCQNEVAPAEVLTQPGHVQPRGGVKCDSGTAIP